MAKKTLNTQSKEELLKNLATKRTELAKVVCSVSAVKPTQKTALRKDIARLLTAIGSMDKSQVNV